jgi:hypothetical protein
MPNGMLTAPIPRAHSTRPWAAVSGSGWVAVGPVESGGHCGHFGTGGGVWQWLGGSGCVFGMVWHWEWQWMGGSGISGCGGLRRFEWCRFGCGWVAGWATATAKLPLPLPLFLL